MKKILAVVLAIAIIVVAIPISTFYVSAYSSTVSYKTGDIVEFGSYPQSAIKDSNGATVGFNNEPIKWRILKTENGKALLLSSLIIDAHMYNHTSATVNGYYGNNYAHSDVRNYLINDFYNTAFSNIEKSSIIATTLDNSAATTSVGASGSYTKYSSESTTDKVFLLSKSEAEILAKNYYGTTATDYAYYNGFFTDTSNGYKSNSWSLRTAGNNTFQIYVVQIKWGQYTTYFNWDDSFLRVPFGIRPAIWVDLQNFNNYSSYSNQVSNSISNLDFGPYALKGATINIAGYDIPLINLQAKVKLGLASFKIVSDEKDQTVKVLVGFDDNQTANIVGAKNSTTYWSESYKEVKSLYQNTVGKKVDTTRLWNQFSALRGKLKTFNADMVVNVSGSMAGFIEYKNYNGKLKPVSGGIMVSFNANTDLRQYYGPAYVFLGISADIDGSLYATWENQSVGFGINVNPQFELSIGCGVGTKNTYAEGRAYGLLSTTFSTDSSSPFTANLDLGVRWAGYIIGKEIFSGSKPFKNVQLYPKSPEKSLLKAFNLTPQLQTDNLASYINEINSSTNINRDYLNVKPTKKKALLSASGNTKFVKNNLYPINQPNLVSFDNDNMLLVWIDDNGQKANENMGTVMYSFYNGTNWSSPCEIIEDGCNNDSPYVYSDGRYAYIVWQKAIKEFEPDTETMEMLENFDLCEITFDSNNQSFSDIKNITSGNNTFEFNPVIWGNNGDFTVAWVENTDNNIYQGTGTNNICTKKYNIDGIVTDSKKIETNKMINDICIVNNQVFCLLYEKDQGQNLYSANGSLNLVCENVAAISCDKNKLYYTANELLNVYNAATRSYETPFDISNLNSFKIVSNGEKTVLFTEKTNSDFSTDLYCSELLSGGIITNTEIYCKNGTYIRNYSPVMLSDETILTALNEILLNDNTDFEVATLSVNGKTNNADLSIDWVIYDNADLIKDTINLNMSITNNSSVPINGFKLNVLDKSGNTIDSITVDKNVDAFSSIEYTLPFENHKADYITVQIENLSLPDLNLSNNSISTTIECLHLGEFSSMSYPTFTENGHIIEKCKYCGEVVSDTILPTYIRGDIVLDDEVNAEDLTELRKVLLFEPELSEEQCILCDLNTDYSIDIRDLVRLKKILAGLL